MTHIELVDSELRIDGVPRVLMAASLFPFRVPPEQWRERIRAVALLGYDMLDVYVPWNYHEVEPGQWDFSGTRDIDHFLTLAREEGLLVLARPGPYICSEWDGGGLPAWLSQQKGLRIRQNEPRYLSAVSSWFDRILPILARHQVSRGGAVALVQLENELDFFDCDDPEGYVTALAALARNADIGVPLVACAGQGDVVRAGGAVPEVAPAVNLYPSDESHDVERHARHYETALRERGMPLLVTETNRLHRTLKRMLVSGAKLLGPYLQASGWNGEYGTAVNNWGDLLGFMTHDYDFGGVLRPDGSERSDAAEARRLTGLIAALGTRLAAGVPPSESSPTGTRAPSAALDLAGGGRLVSVCSLDGRPDLATIEFEGSTVEVDVPADRALLLVRGMPLASVEARIEVTDSELVALSSEAGTARLTFASRSSARVVLRTTDVASVTGDGDLVVERSDVVTITGRQGVVHLTTAGGSITVVVHPAEPDPEEHRAAAVEPAALEIGLGTVGPWRQVAAASAPVALERVGAHRGAGRYSADVDLDGALGLLLRAAADVVDVRIGTTASDWRANGGADLWWPLDGSTTGTVPVTLTTRIWGHSNFDDSRLPSLRLGAGRGLTGILVVRRRVPFGEGWMVRTAPSVGGTPAPRSGFGGWMSSTFPQAVTYETQITADQVGAGALHLSEGGAPVTVALDGVAVGRLDPRAPTLWLGELTEGSTLSLTTLRSWGEPTGELELLLGDTVDPVRIDIGATPELLGARNSVHWSGGRLPLAIGPGESVWVRLPAREVAALEDTVIRFAGRRILVTALVGDRLLGRVWSEAPEGATLKGGRGDLMIVPAPWAVDGVDLLVEATAAHAELTAIRIGGPIDLEN